eukprot:CAMPEP_0177659118 /NCGR_PEP_ID=MMETSP0447-20121125/17258_1 /TAXON_ID=0 /ORGANISM="Stygamoeba regulata, Strain BSH-02190019" /LENGTH=134 /DNA_ID=CAMNT_0019163939 /DNA_START=44 /DNA_END=448 /DNA_ORIENTATION=+
MFVLRPQEGHVAEPGSRGALHDEHTPAMPSRADADDSADEKVRKVVGLTFLPRRPCEMSSMPSAGTGTFFGIWMGCGFTMGTPLLPDSAGLKPLLGHFLTSSSSDCSALTAFCSTFFRLGVSNCRGASSVEMAV